MTTSRRATAREGKGARGQGWQQDLTRKGSRLVMHHMLESGEGLAKVADTVHKLSLMLQGEGEFSVALSDMLAAAAELGYCPVRLSENQYD